MPGVSDEYHGIPLTGAAVESGKTERTLLGLRFTMSDVEADFLIHMHTARLATPFIMVTAMITYVGIVMAREDSHIHLGDIILIVWWAIVAVVSFPNALVHSATGIPTAPGFRAMSAASSALLQDILCALTVVMAIPLVFAEIRMLCIPEYKTMLNQTSDAPIPFRQSGCVPEMDQRLMMMLSLLLPSRCIFHVPVCLAVSIFVIIVHGTETVADTAPAYFAVMAQSDRTLAVAMFVPQVVYSLVVAFMRERQSRDHFVVRVSAAQSAHLQRASPPLSRVPPRARSLPAAATWRRKAALGCCGPCRTWK